MLQVRKEGPGQGPGHTETRNRDMEGCGRVPKMRRVEGGQMKTKRKADKIYDPCPQFPHPISFFNPLYQQLAEKDEEIADLNKENGIMKQKYMDEKETRKGYSLIITRRNAEVATLKAELKKEKTGTCKTCNIREELEAELAKANAKISNLGLKMLTIHDILNGKFDVEYELKMLQEHREKDTNEAPTQCNSCGQEKCTKPWTYAKPCAFWKPIAPKEADKPDDEKCPKCGGVGRLYDPIPFSGKVCPDCQGTGKTVKEMYGDDELDNSEFII